MSRHALVLNGEMIAGPRDFEPNVDQSELAEGKPRWLPVEVDEDAFDAISQVQEGPTYEVEAARIVERYTSRAKNADEIEEMRQQKDAAIESVFVQLCDAHIAYTVDDVEYMFHGDAEARENIMGILAMYNEAEAMGLPVPPTRNFNPVDTDDPIQMTRNDFRLLGMLIGQRKDVLHTIKKARQKAVKLMTDPTEIHAVDPTTGWEQTP